MQTDQLDTRLKAVGLVGDLFSLPGSAITEAFQPIFSEFLKRLSDRVVTIRMCVLECVKGCLLPNPFRAEAAQIICKSLDGEALQVYINDSRLILTWFNVCSCPL